MKEYLEAFIFFGNTRHLLKSIEEVGIVSALKMNQN